MPAHKIQPSPPLGGSARERALDGLFLGSPVPMLLTDVRSHRVVQANAAMGALLGCEPEALKNRALRDLDAGNAENVAEHLLLALACGDSSPRQRTWRAGAGDPVTVEIQATRLNGDSGTLLALYVREARSTPEVATEEEDGGTQRQQRRARKHEAVGRLAVGFAQEFSTIMNGIVRTARGIQKEGSADARMMSELESVVESGARARRLAQALLTFTGQQTLQPRTVSLNEVVGQAERTLRDALSQDIGLMVRLSAGSTEVSADPERLREVLVQLVERAEQAMPEGGYLVVSTEGVVLDEGFVRLHPSTRPGPHVLLTVTDTGEAMDEVTQQRLFEPFFSTGDGGGLGLATVYGIVKQSGGTIWVTSQPGAGTTFRVYLPGVEA